MLFVRHYIQSSLHGMEHKHLAELRTALETTEGLKAITSFTGPGTAELWNREIDRLSYLQMLEPSRGLQRLWLRRVRVA